MGKRIALHDHVMVDGVDLSRFARNVRTANEHAQEDVSGFTVSGANEYLAGATTQSVTVEFYGSYGTGEVHETLWPIFKNREVVPFEWRPDQNQPVSATNPQYEGNAQLFSYAPGASRGEVDAFEVTFMCADELGFDFSILP